MADFVSKHLGKSIRKIRRLFGKRLKSGGMDYSLFDSRGRRKYLLPIERRLFLQAALEIKGPTASFCAVLALTGARISEVLALTPNRIDETNGSINFETLKQRRRGIIRAIPVPPELTFFLNGVHNLDRAREDPIQADERLWTWSRSTAYRRVKLVMQRASVPSFVAMPKALRHAFGVEAALEGVIITMVQKWLGHSDIRTTTVYTTVIGKEERTLAQKTYRNLTNAFRR